jgi:hypothetical protein
MSKTFEKYHYCNLHYSGVAFEKSRAPGRPALARGLFRAENRASGKASVVRPMRKNGNHARHTISRFPNRPIYPAETGKNYGEYFFKISTRRIFLRGWMC